jgi:hypothetical protein
MVRIRCNHGLISIIHNLNMFLQVGPTTFEAKLQPHLLWSLDQVSA